MQLVHFTDEKIGSFDWELPKDVASLLSQLPSDAQESILQELETLTKAHVRTMVATLKMGCLSEACFDLIRSRMGSMTTELKSIAIQARDAP